MSMIANLTPSDIHTHTTKNDTSNAKASVNRRACTKALYSTTPTPDAFPLTSSAAAHIQFTNEQSPDRIRCS